MKSDSADASTGIARTHGGRQTPATQVWRGTAANKEIGARLGASETAIKATLQQLFRKARVRTRGQLVRIVLEGSLTTRRKA